MGNPSDGYHGRTISFLHHPEPPRRGAALESPELEILPNTRDHSRFESIEALVSDVRCHGYYGGIVPRKVTVRRFYDYCRRQRIPLHERNFTPRYHSDIPSQVGFGRFQRDYHCLPWRARSSGINEVEIPRPLQPGLILSVETEELGIPAGLQDRVIQVYEGL